MDDGKFLIKFLTEDLPGALAKVHEQEMAWPGTIVGFNMKKQHKFYVQKKNLDFINDTDNDFVVEGTFPVKVLPGHVEFSDNSGYVQVFINEILRKKEEPENYDLTSEAACRTFATCARCGNKNQTLDEVGFCDRCVAIHRK